MNCAYGLYSDSVYCGVVKGIVLLWDPFIIVFALVLMLSCGASLVNVLIN